MCEFQDTFVCQCLCLNRGNIILQMNITIIRGILKFTSQVERLRIHHLKHNFKFSPNVSIYSAKLKQTAQEH